MSGNFQRLAILPLWKSTTLVECGARFLLVYRLLTSMMRGRRWILSRRIEAGRASAHALHGLGHGDIRIGIGFEHG